MKNLQKMQESGSFSISTIPTHWKISRLLFICSTMKGAAFKSLEFSDDGIPVVKVSDFTEDSVEQEPHSYIKDSIAANYKNVSLAHGDILLSTVGSKPDVRGSMVGKAVKLPKSLDGALLNQNIVRLRPKNQLAINDFVFYVLRSTYYLEHIASIAHGTANQASITLEELLDYYCFLPPIYEQKTIAQFLDRKTTAIDTLIAKKQRLIELLEEKRSALINQAVTKGLDRSVRMKDSGILWIGEIPEHWKINQLRRYIRKIEQGWSPVAYERNAENDEWAVIKLSAVSKGRFYPKQHKALTETTEPEMRFEIQHGDLLISRSNTPLLVGEACYVNNPPPRLMLCDLIYRLDIDTRFLSKRFCAYFLCSKFGKSQIAADARGTSQSMVKIAQGHIKDWNLPVPASVDEQEKIADDLDQNLILLDAVSSKINTQIEKLQEYRQSLITAAVTGKLPIPD